MNLKSSRPASIDKDTTIREVVSGSPDALTTVIRLGIPVSCADRTIGEAARVIGLDPDRLLASLQGSSKDTLAPGRTDARAHPTLEPNAATRADQPWSRPRKPV